MRSERLPWAPWLFGNLEAFYSMVNFVPDRKRELFDSWLREVHPNRIYGGGTENPRVAIRLDELEEP